MNKKDTTDINTKDLVRFLHPLTGKKEIGLVVKQNVYHKIRLNGNATYVRYGIISRKELIWITADKIYELEKIDF